MIGAEGVYTVYCRLRIAKSSPNAIGVKMVLDGTIVGYVFCGGVEDRKVLERQGESFPICSAIQRSFSNSKSSPESMKSTGVSLKVFFVILVKL
jgi:hypothetical protein